MRVVIADDEPLARERLRDCSPNSPGIEVVAEAGDGREALHACAEHHPDLVLLDIAMPGIDGLEAARHLAAFEPRPAVVFCTAYDAHALSAFEAAAIDYLVKPVRPERLAAALERARTFAAGRDADAPPTARAHGQRRTPPVRAPARQPAPDPDRGRALPAGRGEVRRRAPRARRGPDRGIAEVAGRGIRRPLRAHPPQLPGRAPRDRRTASAPPTATCRRCCATASSRWKSAGAAWRTLRETVKHL